MLDWHSCQICYYLEIKLFFTYIFSLFKCLRIFCLPILDGCFHICMQLQTTQSGPVCWIVCRGYSNKYPQHMFLWRTVQSYPLIIIKYPSYLFHWNLHPYTCLARSTTLEHQKGSDPAMAITVMILSFRTDRSEQIVQTQIRLLLYQDLHCLPFRLHRLDSLLYGRAT